MRLLVVEDEQAIREQLEQLLQKEQFAVDACSNGIDALHMGREIDYDLALIDLGLPEMDGIEVIRTLRAEQRNFPILVLTARDRWQDKVTGLEAGGDDYVTKPFQPEEVIARINALLRRSVGMASSKVNFGALELDIAAKQCLLNGEPLELTSFEYNILEYLSTRPRQTISKSQLTEHLYNEEYDPDSNVLEVLMGRLRKKIDPDGSLKPITTLRGQGYRFDLEAKESS